MQKTIKWTMPEENMIKFVEDSKPYEYSSAVGKFMESKGFKDGDSVIVEIDESLGDNGTVVKISKNDNASSKDASEVKKEEPKNDYDKPKESVVEGKTISLTVKAISIKNKGILFTDDEKKWYTFTEEVEQYISENSISRGCVVEVLVEERAKGNDFIVKMKNTSQSKAENVSENKEVKNDYDKPKATYKKNENLVQLSIECQASVNSANSTVANLFAGKIDYKDKEAGVVIKEIISSLAKHNYNLIQELKNH